MFAVIGSGGIRVVSRKPWWVFVLMAAAIGGVSSLVEATEFLLFHDKILVVPFRLYASALALYVPLALGVALPVILLLRFLKAERGFLAASVGLPCLALSSVFLLDAAFISKNIGRTHEQLLPIGIALTFLSVCSIAPSLFSTSGWAKALCAVPVLSLFAIQTAASFSSAVLKRHTRPASSGLSLDQRGRPNVVLILIDMLRYDRLCLLRGSVNLTPEISALLETGESFPVTVSQSPWTKPSVGSIFTSMYPESHGANVPSGFVRKDAATLAELLSGEGYDTASFCSNAWVSPEFGLADGFALVCGNRGHEIMELAASQVLLDLSELRRTHVHRRVAAAGAKALKPWLSFVACLLGCERDPHSCMGTGEMLKRADAWLRSRPDSTPFFLYFHMMDVHNYTPLPEHAEVLELDESGSSGPPERPSGFFEPFDAMSLPGEEEMERIVKLYDASVLSADWAAGQIFERLSEYGLYENSLIVVVSDHGEEFAEHGGWGHGHSLYEEVLRVPLVVRFPFDRKLAHPARVRSVARLVDLFPTVCDVTGLPVPGEAVGTSLTKSMPDGEPDVAYSSYDSEDAAGARARSLRTLDAKLLLAKKGRESVEEYYDLARDPSESAPVKAIEEEDEAAHLKRLLMDISSSAAAESPVSSYRTLPRRMVDQLKGAGYLN